MKPYEIIKNIFIVGGPDITDGRDGCVYLLNLGELVLIDSGAGWSVDKIVQNAEELGFGSMGISRIFLTHCHIDHSGGVPEIKSRFGSKVYVHKLDAPPLENGDSILTAAKWYQTTLPPIHVDVKLNLPEEILRIGTEKITFLHTPGHTPGSLSIYLDTKGKRVIFAQDIHGPLLPEFGSNLDDWDRSTQRLLDLQADILCEGHFGVYKTRKEVKNYILSLRRQYGVE